VRLQDLPAKTFHHLLKSVTWTEIDAAFPIKNPLRKFVSRVVLPGRWFASVRQSYYIIRGRMIDRLLRIRTGYDPAPKLSIDPIAYDARSYSTNLRHQTKEVCTMAHRYPGKESRWGERVNVNIPVQVSADTLVGAGCMKNLSLSGALVNADAELRLHSLIKVNIKMPSSQRGEAITAYVSRKVREGVGVEWCEFAPSVVKDLLRSPSIPLPS
jgi:hypothetical protein